MSFRHFYSWSFKDDGFSFNFFCSNHFLVGVGTEIMCLKYTLYGYEGSVYQYSFRVH